MRVVSRVVLAACVLALTPHSASAQSPDYKNGYAQGFKDGFAEGYKKAQDEARGNGGYGVAPVPAPSSRSFTIVVASAAYGPEYGGQSCDATGYVAQRANGRRSANINVTNGICGDPAPGKRKSLEITYYCGQATKSASGYEHRAAYLSCD